MFANIVFPEGRRKIVTFSFDDGRAEDVKLTQMMNHYGLKGTFHLNAGMISLHNGGRNFISRDDVENIYKGHEVACHGYTHPFFSQIPLSQVLAQLWEERKLLEEKVHYPIRGMSYPYGDFTDEIAGEAQCLGMEYSRTIRDTGKFGLPDDFMRWNPTCHIREAELLMDDFLAELKPKRLYLFMMWGHSYEIGEDNSWEYTEKVFKKLSGREDIWYADSIEIKDYISAARGIKSTTDGKYMYNPSAVDVYLEIGSEIIKIPAGGYENVL